MWLLGAFNSRPRTSMNRRPSLRLHSLGSRLGIAPNRFQRSVRLTRPASSRMGSNWKKPPVVPTGILTTISIGFLFSDMIDTSEPLGVGVVGVGSVDPAAGAAPRSDGGPFRSRAGVFPPGVGRRDTEMLGHPPD